jgi:3-oxoacyl-[acyl-carrier protein] reductase
VAKDIHNAQGAAVVHAADITQAQAVDELVDRLRREARVIGLVNNAGINRRGSLASVNPDDFHAVMQTNVEALLFLTQKIVSVMQDGGSIVNIASVNAFDVLRGVGLYAASKAAVVQLTRSMAIDFAVRSIRVNAVAPGFILTDFNASLWQKPEMKQWVETNTPLGRLGTPQDVAGAVRFLIGPDSQFITGSVVTVDGGFLSSRLWPLDLS